MSVGILLYIVKWPCSFDSDTIILATYYCYYYISYAHFTEHHTIETAELGY